MMTTNGSAAGHPAPPAGAPVRPDEPSAAETYSLAIAAVAAAVLTVLFESRGPVTVVMLTLALLPWALVVAGVRVPLWLFVVGTMAPAAEVIAAEGAGAPVFIAILAVARVFSVTGSHPARAGAVLAALALAVTYGIAQEGDSLADSGALYFAIGVGVGALAGYQSYRQRLLTAELRWTYERLNAARAAEERRRIAREVHDVVAHSLTIVMLSVSGARKALTSRPELAAEALDQAEQVGRESLDGIRRVVGLLRDTDEPASAPMPTAADLRSIVDQQRLAGANVSLEVAGDLGAVDSLAGAAVARISQEALTNAQRHAPGAPVRVRVEVLPDRIDVAVENGAARSRALDARGMRQGLGLLGMRERVEALGGTFSAGPAGDGGTGWRVAASIPMVTRPAPPLPADLRP